MANENTVSRKKNESDEHTILWKCGNPKCLYLMSLVFGPSLRRTGHGAGSFLDVGSWLPKLPENINLLEGSYQSVKKVLCVKKMRSIQKNEWGNLKE